MQPTSTDSDYFNLFWIEIMNLNMKVEFIALSLIYD